MYERHGRLAEFKIYANAAAQRNHPLLLRWSQGDQAALDQLMPVVYEELRKLAQSYLRRERPGSHAATDRADQ